MDVRMGKALLWFQVAINMLAMILTTTPKYSPSTTLTNGSSYEFIIVGGGTAGSVIATRLAEARKIVLLIEAGGDPPYETEIPSLVSRLRNTSVDWKYSSTNDGYTEQCSPKRVLELGIGKMLGGTSELNYMIYSRGHVRNYDHWYRITNDTTWKWSNVLPYYMKSENVTDEKLVGKGSYGTKGPVKVSRDRYAITKEYLQAFKQAGKRITTGTDGNKLGYFQGVITTYMGRRQAGASSYLTRVKNNRYLTIAKHSLATKILFDDRKNAVAVEVMNDKNRTVTIKATKEIIVTAGAVKSAQLLLLSGIGPKAHLDKMKIKVIVDSPQVGKNLQDHTAAVLFHRTNKLSHSRPQNCGPRDYITPLLVGYVALNKSCEYPDYQAMDFIVTDSGLTEQLCKMLTTLNDQMCQRLLNLTRNREVLLSLISNVDTISRGQITLRSTNPKDQPRIESGVYSEGEDLEGMIDYVIDYVKVEGTDIFRKIGATMVDPSLKCNKYKKGSRAYWRCYSLCIMSSMGHYSGTCAMGPVLDSRLYVRGVRRMRVADASMMPTLVCGNPQQPIMAVAEKVSDWLIKGQ